MGYSTLWLDAPAPDADRRTRLVYVRDLCLRVLLVSLPAVVFIAVIGGGVAGMVVVVGFAAQLLNVVWLQLKVRRL